MKNNTCEDRSKKQKNEHFVTKENDRKESKEAKKSSCFLYPCFLLRLVCQDQSANQGYQSQFREKLGIRM